MLVAAIVAVVLCRRKGIERYDIVYSAVYVMIGAMVGAKLLFLAVSARQIIEQEIPFVAVLKGGFVFYGGLLGGLLGLWIYVKQFHMRFLQFAEVYATILPLGHAFGRVGCFFAGCCYGIPYEGPLSHMYHISIGNTPIGVALFPVQLLEAMCLLILFFCLLIVYLKSGKRQSNIPVYYFMSYSIMRFALEFLRGDKERGVWFFATSQWISLLLFCVTTVYLIHKKRRFNAKENIQ